MPAVEARDIRREMRGGSRGVQVRVALRATYVRGDCQARVSAMFCMARGASGCEYLVRVMQGRIVAGIATLIAGARAECACLRHVARAAPRREHRMRSGHSASAIDSIV